MSIIAKELERDHKWNEAKQQWLAEGNKEEASIVDTIIQAIQKGDEYRELTAKAMDQFQNRIINISQLDEILRKAHNEIYS